MPSEFSEMSETDALVPARADCPSRSVFGRAPFSVQDRAEFARVLGRGDPGRVRLVQKSNRLSEWVSWSEVKQEESYAVCGLRENRLLTVPLDFDAKNASAELAHGDAAAVYDLLRGFGVPAVMAASGPSGGRHVLVTVRDGDGGLAAGTVEMLIEGLKQLHLQTLDVSPLKSGMIRPPGSPHRDSGWSEIIGDRTEALGDLKQGAAWNDLTAFIRCLPRISTKRGGRRAPGDSESMVRFRDRSYKSGSEAVFALAMHFAGRGATFEEFERMARRPGVHQQVENALARREPAWLKQDWARAVRKAKLSPAKPKAPTLEYADSEVLASWRSSLPAAGLSAEATNVAEVFLQCAASSGRAFVGMSARGLAVQAGESKSTAARRLKTLEASGLIEPAVPGRTGDGARFRMKHSSCWNVTPGGTVRSSRTSGGVYLLTVPETTDAGRLATDRQADVWSGPGAGKVGMYAYRSLVAAEGDVSTSNLAHALGCSDRRVGSVMKKLELAGLARKVGRGLWAAEFTSAHAAAMRLGVHGVLEGQRSAYEVERRNEQVRRTRIRLDREACKERRAPLPNRLVGFENGTATCTSEAA